MFAIFSIFLVLMVLSPTAQASANLLPDEFIDSDGNVCIKKYAQDGCNTCILDWAPWSAKNFQYSCTELGCYNPKGPKGECIEYAPGGNFKLPEIEQLSVENCKTLLLENRICELGFDRQKGFDWVCRDYETPLQGTYTFPICSENYAEEKINLDKLEHIQKTEEAFREEDKQKEIQKKREAYLNADICLEYESACYRHIARIYPPQTDPIKLRGFDNIPKYGRGSEKMRQCLSKHGNKKQDRKCTHSIKRKDMPSIEHVIETYWLERHPYKETENCVMYENACIFNVLRLQELDGELVWAWWPVSKQNCSADLQRKMAFKEVDTTKTCTSVYQSQTKDKNRPNKNYPGTPRNGG